MKLHADRYTNQLKATYNLLPGCVRCFVTHLEMFSPLSWAMIGYYCKVYNV